jgi:hypothetical protein
LLPIPVPAGHYITATARPLTGYETSEFSNGVIVANTKIGTGVEVIPVDEGTGKSPVVLTFDEVTDNGYTSLEISDTVPDGPNGYILGDSTLYYDLNTTAVYTDSITICINYDSTLVPQPESHLVLLHYDTTLVPDDWVDVTTSLDTVANIICGRSATLSPFVALRPDPLSDAGDYPVSPHGYALYQNVPNPFNPATVIRYDVPVEGVWVTLRVFDVRGGLVATLVDQPRPGGRQTVTWDGTDRRGQRAASGIYFYRMTAGHFVQTRKMLLLK